MNLQPLLLAYSLSGAAGLRASWVMLAVSLGVHYGLLHPDPSLAWVGSWWLIGVSGVASIAEFFADKVPAVDHVVHAANMILAPIVGALTSMSGVHGGDPTALILAGVFGAGNALFLHSARSAVRAGSTVATGGLANPVVSFIEDGVAAATVFIALVAPWVTALAVAIVSFWLVRLILKLRKPRSSAPA